MVIFDIGDSMFENGVDACREVIREMFNLGFSQQSIEAIERDHRFVEAEGKDLIFQKFQLTMVLYNTLIGEMSKNPQQIGVVPTPIRIALNAGTSPEGWIDDVKLTILPFLKENESKFFG